MAFAGLEARSSLDESDSADFAAALWSFYREASDGSINDDVATQGGGQFVEAYDASDNVDAVSSVGLLTRTVADLSLNLDVATVAVNPHPGGGPVLGVWLFGADRRVSNSRRAGRRRSNGRSAPRRRR